MARFMGRMVGVGMVVETRLCIPREIIAYLSPVRVLNGTLDITGLRDAADFMNAQYFAEITLGTPPQNVSRNIHHAGFR